jgi:signal transduction histidine kinase
MRARHSWFAAMRPALFARQVHRTGAIAAFPGARYLRGLTPGRVALVLLICAAFSVRQLSLCVFQINCGSPSGRSLAQLAQFLGRQFLFSLPMLVAVTVADNATARCTARVRIFAFAAAVLLGATAYAFAFLHTQPENVLKAAEGRHSVFIVAYLSRALLYGGLAAAALYFFVREREETRGLHAAKLAKVSLDQQMLEARLRALQAQIEPHFLFNTLANIRLLYDTESAQAKRLIHDLAAYLRTALPQMRETMSTLARELALAQAYLRVLQVRMGERLKVGIDVPADLGKAVVPPMMLSTLVENAIKHGLSPLPQGGSIVIRAERLGDRLRIAVVDDGAGFLAGSGSGVGLANTRARLRALYGAAGRVILDANPRGGVVAVLELPFESAVAGTAASGHRS